MRYAVGCLQMQLIEALEVIDRIKTKDEGLNSSLSKLFTKLEDLTLMQADVFERYVNDKKHFQEESNTQIKTNKKLLEELHDNNRRMKAMEETVRLLENKNLTDLERKLFDKMKEAAILDQKLISLSRKYECLEEEERKIKKYADDMEHETRDKDTSYETTIAKLKEWKSVLTFYLRALVEKLKKSVNKDKYDNVIKENKYLREKQHEMTLRDTELTKKISSLDSLKLRVKEAEEKIFEMEDEKIELEIEHFYVHKKLESASPNYSLQQNLFRRLTKALISSKMSINEIKKRFDPNGDGFISKRECKIALTSLNMEVNKKELELLISFFDEDSDGNVDVQSLIRKLSRQGLRNQKKEEEQLIETLQKGLQTSGVDLQSAFEVFDNNGDGTVKKHEFKFALENLGFTVSDIMMDKIIYMINGDLDNDVIDFQQFCTLFNTANRKETLHEKRMKQYKNSLDIDWKTSLLSEIINSIHRNNLTLEQAFTFIDENKSGSLNQNELKSFLSKLNVVFDDDKIKQLFALIDADNSGEVQIDEFIWHLKESERKVKIFKQMTDKTFTDDDKKIESMTEETVLEMPDSQAKIELIKLKNKLLLHNDKERYFDNKIKRLQVRSKDLERYNEELIKQIEEINNKYIKTADSYLLAKEELSKLSIKFSSHYTKEEVKKIEDENEVMKREVTFLRVGLNSFRDLNKISTKQAHALKLKITKSDDELTTYKKAVKELQSESDLKALIGKLYYSLLISRWRESEQIRKHDLFLDDFQSLKEENIKLESDNKNYVEEITQLQSITHTKIIENTELANELAKYTSPIITLEQLEDLKQLVRDISLEKYSVTSQLFTQMREKNELGRENEELKSKIDYAESLARNLKSESSDELSDKIINLSTEITKIRLESNINARQNMMYKEKERYLENMVEHNNKNVKQLEELNCEMEKKNRIAEEQWRKKDLERQKVFFEQLKSFSLDDMKYLGKNPGVANVTSNLKQVVGKNGKLEEIQKEMDNLKNKNIALKDLVNNKNDEIRKLTEIINQYKGDVNIPQESLLPEIRERVMDEETAKLAETAHTTVKTLQTLLKKKNTQLEKKDDIIEQMKKDKIVISERFADQVQKLQEQLNLLFCK